MTLCWKDGIFLEVRGDFVFVCVSDLQVLLDGSKNRYILRNLRPSTEYEVMLTAVFRDEFESDTVSVVETTCTYSSCLARCRRGFLFVQSTRVDKVLLHFPGTVLMLFQKIRPPSSPQPRSMAIHFTKCHSPRRITEQSNHICL